MLQIGTASPVELALPQVVRANIVFALLICLCISACPLSFHVAGRGEGCRFVADNNGSGSGRDQTLLFLL